MQDAENNEVIDVNVSTRRGPENGNFSEAFERIHHTDIAKTIAVMATWPKGCSDTDVRRHVSSALVKQIQALVVEFRQPTPGNARPDHLS